MPFRDDALTRSGPAPGLRPASHRGVTRSVCGFVFAFSLLFAAFFGVPDLLAYFEASATAKGSMTLVEITPTSIERTLIAADVEPAGYRP